MDLSTVKYAALLCFFYCAKAQYTYFNPFQVQDRNIFHQSYPGQSYVLQEIRRADACGQYPGSTCMFVLLCIMGGGMPTGTCPGSFLSTCCVPPSLVTQPPPPPRNTYRWSSVKTAPTVQTVRKTTTEVPLLTTPKPNNVTYCGLIKAKPQSRIIGGNDAMYGEFPWQAHIKLKRQQCGGVLLNKYYVLTAAHCIYQVRLPDISIQLGVYDIQDHTRQENPPQTFTVVEKKVHPKFQYQAAHPDRFDVALLKLDRAVRYQENIVPICLPRKDANFQGRKGLITGWGKTEAGLSNRYGTRLLQKVDVPIISNEQCEQWHEEKGIDITISPEMMCAGYEDGKKDACVGDSGGPLIVNVHGRWVVVGLVSAGFGCAQSKQPGIYHRVPHTVEWLRDNITS